MTTPKKGSSKPSGPESCPELTISFGDNDAFTGNLRCKFTLSREYNDQQTYFPKKLLSAKILPLCERPPNTSYHSALEPVERSSGTLDMATINVMLTSMKAILLLIDATDSTMKYLYTPTSSKLTTLSLVSTGLSPTKRRMMDAKAKSNNKKVKAPEKVVGNIKTNSNAIQNPLKKSPFAWLHVIPSDGNFRPISVPELKAIFQSTLETGTPTPAIFVTQFLPQAILGDMLPKCVAEIQVNKRVLQEFLSNEVLLDETSMYELVSTKSVANTKSLLRHVQIQTLMRLQLYCMNPELWLEITTTKKSSKRATKRRDGETPTLPRDILFTQVTTVLSFSSFILDSSQPFDLFLKETIPQSIYCSAPDLTTDLFEYFEVPNPFSAIPDDDYDSKNIAAVIFTPAKARKAERVKFAGEIDDSSLVKAKSAKKKERQERDTKQKSREELYKSTLLSRSISEDKKYENARNKMSKTTELERSKSLSSSSKRENRNETKEKKEMLKSDEGKSRQRSGETLPLQPSSSGESSYLVSSLNLSRASLLSAKKNSLIKDCKPTYVGSHFNSNNSNYFVQASSTRSRSVERSRCKSAERSRSTERRRHVSVKKTVTGSPPSKHNYEGNSKSRSPQGGVFRSHRSSSALSLRSPEFTTQPNQIVAETPAMDPSKFSQQLESPSAMRHISFDQEPRKPFMTRSNSRGRKVQEQKGANAKDLLQEALAARRANREKFESSNQVLR